MQNELILRYLCAFLIVLVIFLLFLWRSARDEADHYKRDAFMSSEHLSKLLHEYNLLISKLEKKVTSYEKPNGPTGQST